MVDIPGDNTTTATLTVGGSATGVLEVVGDHDWYRIDLTAGQAITVALNGLGDGRALTTRISAFAIRLAMSSGRMTMAARKGWTR